MNQMQKMVAIGAIIVATGCMHAAIYHYYHQREQRSLEQEFVEKLILNELIEEMSSDAKAMADKQEPKAMIVIEDQDALRNALTNNQEPSVIFFYMNGCGWCNKMKPTYEQVVAHPEFAKLQFYMVNGPELQAQNILQEAVDVRVTGYPLFIFMNKGKLIDKQVGGAAAEVFEHKVKSMFPEIFGVIAPLPAPAPAPEAPVSKFIKVVDNQDALKDLLMDNKKPSVIFFHMNGCGWCTKMKPVFDAAAEKPEFANLGFYSVNGPQMNVQGILKEATDQNVTGYPLFIFMNEGKYVDKQVGGGNPESFDSKIKAAFPGVVK